MRYTGEPKRLYEFMDEFAVHCPKCDGRATVSVPPFFDIKNASLRCASCHFTEKMNERKLYRITGKAKCAHCLEWLEVSGIVQKKRPKYINVVCKACQQVNKVSEHWTESFEKYNTDAIADPAFGLLLWYVDEVKGQTIWAYNAAHLEEIKAYVQAKLRERSTQQFKMTMVEKLPDFIKAAKNREEVLKALERMMRKQQ